MGRNRVDLERENDAVFRIRLRVFAPRPLSSFHSYRKELLYNILNIMSVERQPSLMTRTIDRLGSFFDSFLEQPTTPSSDRENSTNEKQEAGNGGDGTEKEIDPVALLAELTFRIGVAVISGYLLTWWTRRMFSGMLPESDEKPANQVYSRLLRILQKRRGADINSKGSLPELSAHERQMAEEILDPDDIESSFADIGGLDATKQEIYELAVLPLVQPELFRGSKLVQPVKGILLYGKPGTGTFLQNPESWSLMSVPHAQYFCRKT